MIPVLLALGACKSIPTPEQRTLKAMTYNIRFNNPDDGPNAWPNRKNDVKRLIQFEQPDLLGIQEGLWGQVQFLDSLVLYGREGVGRDDGKVNGEFSALYYRKDRFSRLDGGTFWLSETPEIPSKGWDAALNRVCTWLILKDLKTGKKIAVFNTHFDHQGMQARIHAADLLNQKAHQFGKGLPVVLMGDFNLTPETTPIKKMQGYFQDAFLVSEQPPFGPEGTFNGFKVAQSYTGRIDYVFVNKVLNVLDYQVRADVRSGGYFLSDHFPVIVRLAYR